MSCIICCKTVNSTDGTNITHNIHLVKSANNLQEVVTEILEKQIDNVSSMLCKICTTLCLNYDEAKARSKEIKKQLLQEQFKTSVLKKMTHLPKTATPKKKIVLPASKLQPLPPNFVINVGNLGAISKPNFTPVKIMLPAPQVTEEKQDKNLDFSPSKTIMDDIETTLASIIHQDVTKNTVGSMPLLDDVINSNGYVNPLKDLLPLTDSERNDLESIEEQPMEIDQECSYAIVQTKNNEGVVKNESDDSSNSTKNQTYFDMNILSSLEQATEVSDNKYLLSKIEILEQEEDESEHAIVVEDAINGPIIRVMSGQRFMYNDREISLVMPLDNKSDHDPEIDNDHNDNGNGDSQDEDESQIELQMSGDEETANAIIAAAQEQGAFIKVQSGKMYRVKSVQSKVDECDDGNNDHMQLIIDKVGDKYKCLLCEKNEKEVVGEAESIMQHMKSSHDARVYICAVCGAARRRRTDHHAHTLTHVVPNQSTTDKNKVYECNVCHKHYSSRTLLMAHLDAHAGIKPYTCEICFKSYANKYTHQAHMHTHTERPRPFCCKQCNKSFLSQQNLKQHIKTHSGVRDFQCNICKKSFATQHNLEVHGVVHSGRRPFVCSTCGKGFARRAEVTDHMRTHTGERPFGCDMCSATFSQRSNLQSHKRATHYDDKRYCCDSCPKKFKRRRLLEYHIKSSHTGERPYTCQVCCSSFVYPEHYKKHVRIHSGEKPFECEVCGKTFNSRDNRNTHRFVHSDKKPYECLVCGAGYMRKQLLYAHMNARKHLAESIVVNQPRVTKVNHAGKDVLELDTTNDQAKEPPEHADVLTLDSLGATLKDGNIGEINEVLEAETDTSDGVGLVRLVQIQLPDGNNGWVAINS